MKNTFPINIVEAADSQGHKPVLVIACNNRYFTNFSNSNGSHSVATSLAIVDLDANTYINENISK